VLSPRKALWLYQAGIAPVFQHNALNEVAPLVVVQPAIEMPHKPSQVGRIRLTFEVVQLDVRQAPVLPPGLRQAQTQLVSSSPKYWRPNGRK
jgi:hypothetical protein